MKSQFQGMGSGGNNALVNMILVELVPLHERGLYNGYLAMASSLATVSGSIIGAAVSEKSNWRMYVDMLLPDAGAFNLEADMRIQHFLDKSADLHSYNHRNHSFHPLEARNTISVDQVEGG